jgi:hypothetical protein
MNSFQLHIRIIQVGINDLYDQPPLHGNLHAHIKLVCVRRLTLKTRNMDRALIVEYGDSFFALWQWNMQKASGIGQEIINEGPWVSFNGN